MSEHIHHLYKAQYKSGRNWIDTGWIAHTKEQAEEQLNAFCERYRHIHITEKDLPKTRIVHCTMTDWKNC